MTPSQNPEKEEETGSKKVPYHFGEKLRQVREHRVMQYEIRYPSSSF